MSTPEAPNFIIGLAEENVIAFTATLFSFPADGYEHGDVLIACLKDQPSMADFEDDYGNQSAVRLDLVEGVYWVSAKNGKTQADIDAAVAAYPAKLAEMYPDE